jgi:protein-tyrosine-phosphatase
MVAEQSNVEQRARVHAALADPARLTIVDRLMLGDASPGELAEVLQMTTNLVAHHVKVLTEARLVVRSPSEGDRRRSYLRLMPETIASLTPPPLPPVPRVVFVCTHNSARSQLATALWAQRSRVPTTSAGTRPAARVHARAKRIAARHGLALAAATTAHINDVLRDDDFVIAVCDNAHEDLSPTAPPALHWSVPDPARTDTDAAFEAAYTDLASRIERLAPVLTTGEQP